jgi:hypothetical protein
MIGTKVKRKADQAEFTVTAQTEHGTWVLAPDDEFGPPLEATVEQLRDEYGASKAAAPARPDEASGWQRFSQGFRENIARAKRGLPRQLSPEETFEILTGDEATAARIASDADLLAEYESALLDVPEPVARELDRLIAARNAKS